MHTVMFLRLCSSVADAFFSTITASMAIFYCDAELKTEVETLALEGWFSSNELGGMYSRIVSEKCSEVLQKWGTSGQRNS